MKVIKNTTIYLGVSIFQSGMSFLLLPVFTFFLTQSEFGLVNVINSLAGFLKIFFVFGTQSAISRLFFEYKDDENKLRDFFGTTFLFKWIWNISLLAIFLIFRDQIFSVLAEGIGFYPFVLIALGMGFFYTFFVMYQTIQLTKQEGVKYAIGQCAYLVINNGITLFLLVILKLNAVGVILGTLIADIIMNFYVFYRLRSRINFRIDKSILKETLAYEWPIFLHALSIWALASVNKIILNNEASLEVVGIFSIGYVIGSVVSIVTLALNRSYTPWFVEQMKKEKKNYLDIVKFSEFIIIVYSVIALGLSLFGSDLISLLTSKSYGEAWEVVPFVAYGYVFNGVYLFFINIFSYYKKYVKEIPMYSFLSAVVNIGLNYLLIPRYGMIGSAIATLVAMFIFSYTTYIGSKRFGDLGYSYSRILLYVLVPFALSTVVFLDFDFNIWLGLFIKSIYFLFCVLIIYLLIRNRFGENLNKQINLISSFVKLRINTKNKVEK